MSTETRTICDVCGKIKGETNHWWSVTVGDVFLVEPIWHHTDKEKDACGSECCHKLLDQFLSGTAT